MSASKIEQLIEEIYEFVESCKLQAFSTTKVVVPKDELYDLLDELKLRTPDEIKRYQKIIANRDAIISDAEEKAAAMMADAREKTNALINEHEIMQQAYQQANEVVAQASEEADRILESARHDADEIRTGSLAYSEDMLRGIENLLDNAYESTKSKYDELVTVLRDNYNIVSNNRKELSDSLNGIPQEAAAEHEEGDDAFNFDADTFLEDIDD